MNNFWSSLKIYIAGPMEFAEDSGVPFRKDLEKLLIEKGCRLENILNPTNKPIINNNSTPLSDEAALIKKYKSEKNWEELHMTMKKIINIDLRMVDFANLIIAWLPSKTRTTGTIHELISCINQKKMALVVCGSGIENVSAWILGLIPPHRIFKSNKEAVDYLDDLIQNGPKHSKDEKEFIVFDFAQRELDE